MSKSVLTPEYLFDDNKSTFKQGGQHQLPSQSIENSVTAVSIPDQVHPTLENSTSFDLVCDLQQALAKALDSVRDKQDKGILDKYYVLCARSVNRAANGFIFLRQAGKVDLSKLVIKPAMEVIFRLLAVRNHPDLLYRIAYSERLENHALSASSGPEDEAAELKRWNHFTARYKGQFPTHRLIEQELFTDEAAEAAGLGAFYSSQYRLYCQSSHAASRAMADSVDELTDLTDNRTMAQCLFFALEALAGIGAAVSNLDSLLRRLSVPATGIDRSPALSVLAAPEDPAKG